MGLLSDISVFENEVVLGKHARTLRWNNAAIAYGTREAGLTDENTFLQSIADGDFIAVRSAVFGARKAADRNYTVERFEREFKPARFLQYLTAAVEGVAQFLPESRQEARKENGKAETSTDVLGDYVILARVALKMSRAEIMNASPRSITAMLEAEFGEEMAVKDEYYGDEIPWL